MPEQDLACRLEWPAAVSRNLRGVREGLYITSSCYQDSQSQAISLKLAQSPLNPYQPSAAATMHASLTGLAAFGTLAYALPTLPVVGSVVPSVPGLSTIENAVPGVGGLVRRDQKSVVTIINETTAKVQEFSVEFRECSRVAYQ